MSKLQEKPSALKREHLAVQKMNFINLFIFLWVIFALLDPDPIRIWHRVHNNGTICSAWLENREGGETELMPWWKLLWACRSVQPFQKLFNCEILSLPVY
jgi:hypothetical protein